MLSTAWPIVHSQPYLQIFTHSYFVYITPALHTSNVDRRPSFGAILAELERMRATLASQQAAAMAAAAAAGDAGGGVTADGGVGPDGWVAVPPPPPRPPPRDFEEAATISTGMYAEMVGTTMSQELYGGGGGGGVGGFGGSEVGGR